MVRICGKCKHYMKSETTEDGQFHYYCDKADELYGTQEDGATAMANILKIKFNDRACEYYEKNRR